MSAFVEQPGLSENPTVEAITSLIGEELMLRLSCDLGGKQLYIPMVPREHSPITVSIGAEAANKISEIYGGFRIEIPTTAGRDAEVLRLYQSGVNIMQIAHRMRLHRKTIARIIDRRLNSAQADLFSSLK